MIQKAHGEKITRRGDRCFRLEAGQIVVMDNLGPNCDTCCRIRATSTRLNPAGGLVAYMIKNAAATKAVGV